MKSIDQMLSPATSPISVRPSPVTLGPKKDKEMDKRRSKENSEQRSTPEWQLG